MWQTFKSALSFVSGASPTPETATATAAADENEPNGDLERRVEDSGTRQGKRGRESGSPEVGRKVVKRVHLTPHEARLTQTLVRNPPGAIPIAVPTYNDGAHDNDWKPDHNREMGAMKRGIVPSNTLGRPTPQSGPRTFYGHLAMPEHTSLQTKSVRGSNVRGAEEAFAHHQSVERGAKKQKVNPNGRSSQSSPPAVDLTEDSTEDVFSAIPHARSRGGSMGAPHGKSGRSINHDDPFATNESARAASYTTNGKQSASAKRRSGADARNGSQRSSVRPSEWSPPIEIPDDYVDRRAGTSHSPMMIDEDGDGLPISRANTAAQRPPIALDEGLAEIKHAPQRIKPKVARGSRSDLRQTNDLLRPTSVRLTNGPPVAILRAQPQETKLREVFKRDNQTKMKDRMQANSSSPDQLQGSNTILSHSSPEKHSARMPPTSARGNGTQQQRPLPPGMSQQAGDPLASSPSDDYTTDDTNEVKAFDDRCIPIRSIFSKQCVRQQKSLFLVWGDDIEGFRVACGETNAHLPHLNNLVEIGKSDVSVSWTHNSEIAKAMLKGSMNDFSNGTIVLEFEDENGLHACQDHLMHATRDHMQCMSVAADHMEKIFKQQSSALSIANEKLLRTDPPATVSAASRRAGSRMLRVNNDEGVRYEDDGSAPSELWPRSQDARSHEVRSTYFTQETPRKSVRQPKPVAARPRSPTPPPRWSQVHDPVKWQHPVVYPSQGVRRVTVYDSDIVRLDEGEYLNDNLLGFAIRHIEETMDPVHKQKVHFFNTFFYSSLMKNKKVLDYEAVKRWTKNTDIFTVPYTVVPINNALHWYFAIICNLQFLDRKMSGMEAEEEDQLPANAADVARGIIDLDAVADQEMPDRSTNQSGHTLDDGEQRDVYAFNETGQVTNGEDDPTSSRPSTATGKKTKKSKQKATPPTRKYDTTAPVIIMLDSFGHPRSTESTALKKYIAAEAKEKRAMEVDYRDIQGLNAKGLPAQPNFCDCGVYVIGYITEFAKDPDAFVKKVLLREMDAERDFKDFDASETRNRIRDTLIDVEKVQADERKVHKAQKRRKAAQNSTSATPSKQASPVRHLQTVQEPSTAASRSTPAPAPPATKSQRSSPFPTSQTALRSSPGQATPGRLIAEDDDELEVSPPIALPPPGNASSARANGPPPAPDSDEMLDVDPASAGGIPPNPYSQRPVSSSDSSSTTTSEESPSEDEGQEVEAEIADSQGKGY